MSGLDEVKGSCARVQRMSVSIIVPICNIIYKPGAVICVCVLVYAVIGRSIDTDVKLIPNWQISY